MRTRSLLLAAAAISLLGSTGMVSSSYAQTAGGDAGAAAGTGGQMQAGSGDQNGAGIKAGAGADATGGAAAGTCSDGSPMPADGTCPTVKGGDQKPNADAAAQSQTGTQDQNATPASGDNGSGAASDQTNAGGKAGTSESTKSGASDQSGSKSGANSTSNNSTSSKSSSSSNTTVNQTTNVNVTTEQRTEIEKEVKTVHVSPVTVNFSVNVGIVVPHTVHLVPLPATIVKIVPRYHGYLFFMLADGRIVIVEPHSLKIVLII